MLGVHYERVVNAHGQTIGVQAVQDRREKIWDTGWGRTESEQIKFERLIDQAVRNVVTFKCSGPFKIFGVNNVLADRIRAEFRRLSEGPSVC